MIKYDKLTKEQIDRMFFDFKEDSEFAKTLRENDIVDFNLVFGFLEDKLDSHDVLNEDWFNEFIISKSKKMNNFLLEQIVKKIKEELLDLKIELK